MKISVVLPVYNVEHYLKECLNSLIGQSLQDIEIICVNDCSIDGSLLILTEYVARDPRIIIINQRKNLGQSAARNRGLQEAVGEYVYFMDSDDYLAGMNALEHMYAACKFDGIDILSFNHRTIGAEEKEYIRQIDNNTITNGKIYLQQPAMGGVMVWLRLYRREYLESLDFTFIPEIIAEDDEALPRLYYDAKKVKHINNILLVYRRRDSSSSTSAVSTRLIDGLMAVVKTYLILYRREDDAGFKRYLYNKSLEYLYVLYEKILYLDDGVVELEKYRQLVRSIGFTSFERKLIKNEEKFIAYTKIDKRNKKYSLLVYYIHHLRINYYKYIRQY